MDLFKLRCGRRIAFADGGSSNFRYTKIEGLPVILFYGTRRGRIPSMDDVIEEKNEVLIKAEEPKEAIKIFNGLKEVKKGVRWRRSDDTIEEIQCCEYLLDDGERKLCKRFVEVEERRCELEERKYCLL